MSEARVFKAWLNAARLRTLPLSISGILTGSAYAFLEVKWSSETGSFDFIIPILALLTTLGFQILSNFANDYGDGVKGTDNANRVGPIRAIQSGLISPAEMKKGIITTTILTALCAVTLIVVSLGTEALMISLFFMVLGGAAIWAAINYTVGDNAYGYKGLGDLFVFIFFGPVSVLGIYFLITNKLDYYLILPSITVGLLSVAVLNLNNLRDRASDLLAGKNTLVVKIGHEMAVKFHILILIIAFISALIYYYTLFYQLRLDHIACAQDYLLFLPLVGFTTLIAHARVVLMNKSAVLLDPELKKVALSTFFIAILSIISVAVIH